MLLVLYLTMYLNLTAFIIVLVGSFAIVIKHSLNIVIFYCFNTKFKEAMDKLLKGLSAKVKYWWHLKVEIVLKLII